MVNFCLVWNFAQAVDKPAREGVFPSLELVYHFGYMFASLKIGESFSTYVAYNDWPGSDRKDKYESKVAFKCSIETLGIA